MNMPTVAISSIPPLIIDLNFTSSFTTFYFFDALSSLLANFPFQSWFCFVLFLFLISVGLSLGQEEAIQPHALLSVELNNRCAVANHWQTLKGVM